GALCGDAGRKLSRARRSAWRTVEARFVRAIGENNEKTIVYLPEYGTDRFWTVETRLPGPSVRCQIAGARTGLGLRRDEDSEIVRANPMSLGRARTARVAAYAWRDGNLGLRLEVGDESVFVSMVGSEIPPDVGDVAKIHAATVRRGSNHEVVLELGLSR